ncbi:hypothetical protein [Hyalangium sp.]|uniref:hypothetical protein n=1 Tax=Hyalangium sp. TaxID=2028555 RepID=UPI002D5629B6|nr:hypothetical protein [Hyalangium sp.]HYI01361.1 hypothetical protein [Hyalangium sp.]
MPLKDVKQALVDVLEAAEVGSTESTPPTLYRGPMPAGAPDACVSVVELSDPGEDEELLGGAGRMRLVHELTVQVRGPRNVFLAAEAKAVAAWDACWENTPEGYVWVRPTGKPVHLGPDDMGRALFSFTVRVEYRATTEPGSVTPDS